MQKSKLNLKRSLPTDMILLFIVLWSFACQKNNIHRTGLFSQWSQLKGHRQIASSNTHGDLSKFFDVKQVYIYCAINTIAPIEACYQKQTQILLNQYQQKYGVLSPEKLEEYQRAIDLKVVEEQTQSVSKEIMSIVDSQISKLVQKRESFCQENSKFYVERCLKQYIEADSMAVLNQFQSNYSSINGHEYLYLKNVIKEEFIAKLNISRAKLESTEKKS